MRRIFQSIYLVLAALHLISILGNLPLIAQCSKPMLISFLAFAYWKSCATNIARHDKSILAGLIFSWLGDVLLLFADIQQLEILFLAGLGSFLVAHLFYIRAFILFPGTNKSFYPFAFLVIFIYWIGILAYLWPALSGIFMIPVIIYSVVISTMGYFAYLLYKKASNSSSRMVVGGAILFIVSDSLIALNKFIEDIEIWQVSFLIMLTYLAAQWLISLGMLNTKNKLATPLT